MRRSARVAAAADARASALPQLPVSLAARVFRFLPVDEKARAALVCRGWRAFLADAALWTELDLSPTGGVADERITDVLLRGAAAMARGQLQRLDLGSEFGGTPHVTQVALLEVVVANAASLRELRLVVRRIPDAHASGLPNLEALARAAPLLRILEAGIICSWQDAPQLMRADQPLTALKLRDLSVTHYGGVQNNDLGGLERVSAFAAALADTALQPTLSRVAIAVADIQLPEVLNVLVDALLPRPLRELGFFGCTPPAPVPLARLLRGSALISLNFSGSMGRLFDAGGAALVAEALRSSTTLEELMLGTSRLCDDVPAACLVLRALVGHPRLRQLHMYEETPNDGAAVGAALAALVTADSPALKRLIVPSVRLTGAGLTPIMDALPHNQHLRALDISNTGASEAFSRDRLLPAVRINTSLRALLCGDYNRPMFRAEAEAQQLVRSRPPHTDEPGYHGPPYGT